jgi:hypothetical protein
VRKTNNFQKGVPNSMSNTVVRLFFRNVPRAELTVLLQYGVTEIRMNHISPSITDFHHYSLYSFDSYLDRTFGGAVTRNQCIHLVHWITDLPGTLLHKYIFAATP